MFDYAVIHHVPSLFRELARLKFKQAEEPFRNLRKIDQKLMEFFMLQSMIAMFQDVARVKTRWDLPAFETADFIRALRHFPQHVIPARRTKRPYLSSILAKNEVNRDDPYNRLLFVRVRLGRYILNPLLEIDVDGEWINVYDLIGISHLEQEEDETTFESRALTAVLRYVRESQAATAAP